MQTRVPTILLLSASDGLGNIARDTVLVTIISSVVVFPPPAIWHPGNQTVYTNQSHSELSWLLSGGGNSGNTAIVYRNGTIVASGSWISGNSLSVSLDNLDPGTYNFTIIAFDSNGDSVQDSVMVTVIAAQPTATTTWTLEDTLLCSLLGLAGLLVVLQILRLRPRSVPNAGTE